MSSPELRTRLDAWSVRASAAIDARLPAAEAAPQRLHAAMRYAALGPGKRLRPLLVYAAGELCGAEAALLDDSAAAVELIHAYSLVHDDLPAMDDDALRRGRPTVHVAFDEATAILAGDALQSAAFAILCAAAQPAEVRIELLRVLSEASGSLGMAGGQALDLAAVGATLEGVQLEQMHAQKTGALIRAAVRMGALCGTADREALQHLDRYALALGLAFQIRDDLLDVEASTDQLGKTGGKDAAAAKPTYVSMLGTHGARTRLQELEKLALAALDSFGERADALRALCALAVNRQR